MTSSERHNPSESTGLSATLFGALFVLLGIAAFLLLAANINDIVSTRLEGEPFGTTLLRFLNSDGIIVPLIQIGFGIFLFRLGVNLFQRRRTAAIWARQVLLWVAIVLAALALQAFTTAAANPDAPRSGALSLVGAVIAGAGFWWLGQHLLAFEGSETLAENDARIAWNLLIPTLAVLIVVAARPLEATFITSLTDRRFASAREVNFVGLDNYTQLLSVRFDALGCVRAEDGACELDASGNLVFPRPRDVLDESYLDLRYRDVTGVTLGETRILLSARDRDFVNSVGNTLYFALFSVAIELVLGLFIAMVVNSKFAGRGIMRAAMLVPWAIPTVVSARLWEIMLRDNQSGVINHFLVNLGVLGQSQAWLATPALQIPALIAIDVWKTTPFMALILLAGLQAIPGDIYEAANVDGAGRVRQFFQITIPLLRPTIAVALVFRTLDAIRVFDVFQVLLGRQQLSMATYNYEMLVNSQRLGYASAIGVVIFVIILIFTVTYVKILGVSAE